MKRVSLRAILLLICAICIFGVFTYASVKVSKNRNAFEAAFTDLKNILGPLPREKHKTIAATPRSSKGVDFQKPAIDASLGAGTVYAPESHGWKANSIIVQPPSSFVTTHPADLPVEITEAPFHSSSNEPFATPSSGRYPLGFHDTAGTSAAGTSQASSIVPSASTAGPGSATGSNSNAGNGIPCTKPAPESSWIVLVGTAFAFSVIGWSARTMRTWLSRRQRTHS